MYHEHEQPLAAASSELSSGEGRSSLLKPLGTDSLLRPFRAAPEPEPEPEREPETPLEPRYTPNEPETQGERRSRRTRLVEREEPPQTEPKAEQAPKPPIQINAAEQPEPSHQERPEPTPVAPPLAETPLLSSRPSATPIDPDTCVWVPFVPVKGYELPISQPQGQPRFCPVLYAAVPFGQQMEPDASVQSLPQMMPLTPAAQGVSGTPLAASGIPDMPAPPVPDMSAGSAPARQPAPAPAYQAQRAFAMPDRQEPATPAQGQTSFLWERPSELSGAPVVPAAPAPVKAAEATADPQEDAIPTATMAAPVPVGLNPLDFALPKRRVWPLVVGAAAVVVVAVVVLWQMGLLDGLLGYGSPAGQTNPVMAVITQQPAATQQSALAVTQGPAATAAPTSEPAGVSSFTVNQATADAPATLTFTIITGPGVDNIRLMNSQGMPLAMETSVSAEGSGLVWTCSVTFATAYRGAVSAYIRNMEGFWFDSGRSLELWVL